MTSRVLALVEGQTEEAFVKKTLAPWLGSQGVAVSATTCGRRRKQRGVPRWERAQRELLRLLKEDTGRHVTTMFDYYGMPTGWPGRRSAEAKPHGERADLIEQAMKAGILDSMGGGVDSIQSRFIRYVQMHEFEALLFSAPHILAEVLSRDALPEKFVRTLDVIAGDFETPEEIDDDSKTAPSKRILALAPDYQKVTDGSLAAGRIGLATMRGKCPHFDGWLCSLEALGQHQRTRK